MVINAHLHRRPRIFYSIQDNKKKTENKKNIPEDNQKTLTAIFCFFPLFLFDFSAHLLKILDFTFEAKKGQKIEKRQNFTELFNTKLV